MRERFFHHYGQHSTRLIRQESVYNAAGRRHTYIFLLVSPWFFYLPEVYLKKFDGMCVDRIVHERPWNEFWGEVHNDWRRAFIPV